MVIVILVFMPIWTQHDIVVKIESIQPIGKLHMIVTDKGIILNYDDMVSYKEICDKDINNLEIGRTIKVRVCGFNVPSIGMYRNLVRIYR